MGRVGNARVKRDEGLKGSGGAVGAKKRYLYIWVGLIMVVKYFVPRKE